MSLDDNVILFWRLIQFSAGIGDVFCSWDNAEVDGEPEEHFTM